MVKYDIGAVKVMEDDLREDQFDFDSSLSKRLVTILVSTEISAMNHSGQLTFPQN